MRRFSRRRLLQAGVGMAGMAAARQLLPMRSVWSAVRPSTIQADFPSWSRFARLADTTFDDDADPILDMQPKIDALKAQNVSVIELDTILSNWLTNDQFTTHMGKIRSFVDLAHAAAMQVVVYYPSLEVISVGGEDGPSFYKDDNGGAWVQRGLDGRPNVFYGSLVFWVDPGDESCWVSPNSPWRDFYFGRLRALAQTGVDAIWPDVPIYFDGAIPWCDASSWAASAFLADTGLSLPATADFANPTFRRYVEWRHRVLNQWQLDIAAAGRSVNPNLLTFVETVSMDYMDAMRIGLDGAYVRRSDGVSQVWEVDILGNNDGMRHSTATDWTCLISMYKYARAASGQKPAWAFSYGWQADDASLVMSEVLAAGCNPFEVKSPYKTASTDIAMRTRMYRFIQVNEDRLYRATSSAKVAVYHSSSCRDFVSPTPGTGLYANATVPDGVDDWWSLGDSGQSCTLQPWLGEFRGTVKALLYAHIPFNVATSPGLSSDDLAGYKALLLPNLQAVSDAEAAVLRSFVASGGWIVITGTAPTALDQLGAARTEYALTDVLGFRKADPLPASRVNSFGSGKCYFFGSLPGLSYLASTDQASADLLLGPVGQAAPAGVTLTGDQRIHLEMGQLDADTILHLVNFTNFGDTPASFQTTPTTCTVSLPVPAGKQVIAVSASSPDNPSPDPQPIPYSVAGGTVTFTLSVVQYSLAAVTIR